MLPLASEGLKKENSLLVTKAAEGFLLFIYHLSISATGTVVEFKHPAHSLSLGLAAIDLYTEIIELSVYMKVY